MKNHRGKNHHGLKHVALRELALADRTYRAAYEELTSRGGLESSSFDRLRISVKGLQEALDHLRERDDQIGTGDF